MLKIFLLNSVLDLSKDMVLNLGSVTLIIDGF